MGEHTRAHHNTLFAYNAKTDLDTLYLNQVIKHKDWINFRTIMQTKVDDRIKYESFSVI